MIIQYCNKCGRRVAEAEIAAGKTVAIDEFNLNCATCAAGQAVAVPAPEPALSDSSKVIVLPVPKKGTGENRLPTPAAGSTSRASVMRMSPATASGRSSGAHAAHASNGPQARKSQSPAVLAAAGGGVLVLGVLAAVLLFRSGPPAERKADSGEGRPIPKSTLEKVPAGTDKKVAETKLGNDTPPQTKEPGGTPVSVPVDDANPRERMATGMLEQAKAFILANPEKQVEYRAQLEKLATGYRSTAAGATAVQLIGDLKGPEVAVTPSASTTPAEGTTPAPGSAPPVYPSLPDAAAWEKAVKLLMLPVDLEKDALNGKWERKGNSLLSGAGDHTRIAFPYQPPEEYDFRVIFTCLKRGGDVSLLLSQAGQPFVVVLGGYNNTVAGLQMVSGKGVNNNSTTVRRKILDAETKHDCIVRVRKDGVKVYLDGRLLIELADPAQLSVSKEYALPPGKQDWIGLANFQSPTRYDLARVIEVSGPGKLPRAGDVAEAKPIPAVADNSEKAPATTPKPTGSSLPVPLPNDPRLEYTKAMLDVIRQLGENNAPKAQNLLQTAAANPAFAPFKDALKQDLLCTAWPEEVWKAVPAGAALLSDGRAFTLELNGEKPFAVGKGANNRVAEINGDNLEVEQQVGGGKIFRKVPLGNLSPTNRLELARLGLGTDELGRMKAAAAELALLMKAPTGGSALAFKNVRQQLEVAAKEAALAPVVSRLRMWADWIEKRPARRASLCPVRTGRPGEPLRGCPEGPRQSPV